MELKRKSLAVFKNILIFLAALMVMIAVSCPSYALTIANTVWISSSNAVEKTAQYDTVLTPPFIAITAPSNDYDTNVHIITVSGTAFNSRAGESAAVYVNGNAQGDSYILGDSGGWSCTAALTAVGDSVTVRLTDKLGQDTSAEITVNYYPASPAAAITLPADNHDTSVSPITVSGTTVNTAGRNGDTIELFVNDLSQGGTAITQSNGGWSIGAQISGSDSVWIRLTDQFGRVYYDTITVNYYDAPSIGISFPADNHDTNFPIITVSGTTANSYAGDSVEIYVNGVLQSDTILTADSGAWSCTIELTGAGDSVWAALNDTRFNRKAYDTITVNFYASPSVGISLPADDHDTNIQTITISGTTAFVSGVAGDTIELFVNDLSQGGIAVTELNGGWSLDAELTGKGDSVWVRLTDQFGNNVYDTVTVNYYGNLSAAITFPPDGYDTNIQAITVSGTTVNTAGRNGDTIELFVNNLSQGGVSITELNGGWSLDAQITGGDSVWIRLTDQFGRIKYDTITVNYYDAPSIAVTSPADDYDTNIQTITISGTTAFVAGVAGDTIELFVNNLSQGGVAIIGENGGWSLDALLTGKGDSVWVRLTDQFGRVEYDTITVNYYGVLPTAAITLPADNHDTSVSPITVSGTTVNTAGRNGDTIELFVNNLSQGGVSITESNGGWSLEAQISGSDSVWIRLTDQFGRTAYDTITVNYYAAPSIAVTSPADDYDTNIQTITISGTTAFVAGVIGDTVEFFVNNSSQGGVAVIGENGGWSLDALLTGKGDSVWVRLTDQFGRVEYDTITVNYYAAPSVGISFPANNHDTAAVIITVSGTTVNTAGRNGDTVELFVNNSSQGGVSLTQSNGGWSLGASLTGQGDSVWIRLTDQFGRTAYDTITVNYLPLPAIAVNFPLDDYDTSALIINIGGTTARSYAGDSVRVYVNGLHQGDTALTADNGLWNYTAQLGAPGDSVWVRLTDPFARTAYDTITVNYYDAPSVALTFPADNHDTSVSPITVSGTTVNTAGRNGDTIELFVNDLSRGGIALTQSNGGWSLDAALTGRGDSVWVRLTDQFGRTSYDTITVNYLLSPEISVTSPANNSYIYAETITVSGTTINTRAGDTVEIFVNNNSRDSDTLNILNGGWEFKVYISDTENAEIKAVITDQFGRTAFNKINILILERDLVLNIEDEFGDPQLKFTSLKDKVYVTVFDPKKLNDTMVVIHVSSEADANGFNMPLFEIEEDTNIFKGMFMFTEGITGIYREGSIEPAVSAAAIGASASISYDAIYKIHIRGTEKICIKYYPNYPNFDLVYEVTAEFIKEIMENLYKVRTWPNPFMPLRHGNLIVQNLPPDKAMVIEIYNTAGEKIKTLTVGKGITYAADGNLSSWDGRNDQGQYVASGTYVYLVRTQSGHIVRKLTLIK